VEISGVQGAFAQLAWTGSWYEACVALDPLAKQDAQELTSRVQTRLEVARRIGHDLRLVPARRVPLDVELAVCVEPHCLRSEVEQAVRGALSEGDSPAGGLGLFHPDRLVFGADIASSRIIAEVQAVEGVMHVEVTRFARLGARPSAAARSLAENLVRIHADEVAVLSGDRNFPEHGQLTLRLRGGR
jgi:hypothetical protein